MHRFYKPSHSIMEKSKFICPTSFSVLSSWKYMLTIISGILLIFSTSCGDPSKRQSQWLLSALSTSDTIPSIWNKEYWSKQQHYSFDRSDRSKFMTLIIDADSLTYSRWYVNQPVTPYSRYRLSGWIKTEEVVPGKPGGGAGFRVGRLTTEGNKVYTGNTPWTYVEIFFDTEGDDSAFIECVLGKESQAKGRVYFDEIYLERMSSKTLLPEATIDIQKTLPPMNDYIYGQFIEHMGKCIYGGIWAEVISDRKFFYKPGHQKSPWKVLGDTSLVYLDKKRPYTGEQSVVINNTTKQSNGILQSRLGLLEQMEYYGHIALWASADALPIEVALTWGDEEHQADRCIINNIDMDGYHTIPLAFISDAKTEQGQLSIIPKGKGLVRIGAISLMPANNIDGFRPDVLAQMKRLNSPIYRWPGGNFVSGYNWKDGIGDRDKRPTRYEAAWDGIEPNDVGIDEFMRLCQILKTEANIAVNTGLGTPKLAAEMVEYVNGSPLSPMGKLRAANGHTNPYDVKLWAVGNEMFGDWQLGVMPIDEYVKKHNETARLMWAVDPTIELIAVGYPGHWNNMMYTHCADKMTYISEHFYRQDWHAGGLMTHVKQIPDAIRYIADEHRRARREIVGLDEKNILIALDEWNYWYGPHVHGLLGTRYFLQDALGIAAGINEFMRQSDIYYMANYAQTVNVIGAIKATSTDVFMEGTGEVLQLYRREFGSIPVELSGNTAPLDVSAALTKDRKHLTISVINATDKEQNLRLDFRQNNVPQKGQLFIITGPDRYAYNEIEAFKIVEKQKRFSVSRNSIEVPAMSACIFKFELDQSSSKEQLL